MDHSESLAWSLPDKAGREPSLGDGNYQAYSNESLEELLIAGLPAGCPQGFGRLEKGGEPTKKRRQTTGATFRKFNVLSGTPGGTRTPDLLIRSQAL